MKKINVNIDDNHYKMLKELAKETEINFSKHVRNAIERYLIDVEETKENLEDDESFKDFREIMGQM